MVQTPGLIPNPGLVLVMPTANISLKVLKTPTAVTFTVHTPSGSPRATLEDVTDLADWLDTDEIHEGRRAYAAMGGTVVVCKREHTMTREELVEVYVYDGDRAGEMTILTYPQTRALVAYLQN